MTPAREKARRETAAERDERIVREGIARSGLFQVDTPENDLGVQFENCYEPGQRYEFFAAAARILNRLSKPAKVRRVSKPAKRSILNSGEGGL